MGDQEKGKRRKTALGVIHKTDDPLAWLRPVWSVFGSALGGPTSHGRLQGELVSSKAKLCRYATLHCSSYVGFALG